MNYVCVIGGVNQNPQVKKLRGGVDILVAAPGRLLDLINQGHVNLERDRILGARRMRPIVGYGFHPRRPSHH